MTNAYRTNTVVTWKRRSSVHSLLSSTFVMLALVLGLLVGAGFGFGSEAAFAQGEPVYGGTFTKSLNYGDPGSLDPIVKNEVAAIMVTMNMYDRVLKLDPVTGAVEPGLAERWEISADGLTYTFYIRENATFHNGRAIGATDIKYSLERVSNPVNASPGVNLIVGVTGLEAFQQGQASEISGLEVVSSHVLRVHLDEPKPTLLFDLSNIASGVVPKEEVDRLGLDFGQRPVGSGPFKFAGWRKDDEIVLEANADYWAGRPYVDRVVFRIMREEPTRDAEFMAGNLDAMTIGEAQYARYSKDAAWTPYILEVPELFTRSLFLNNAVTPLDNKLVRQALNYAIENQIVVERVLSNKAYAATGPLQSSSAAFNPDLVAYPYNPDRARQLMAEAGYPNGFELEVMATAAGSLVVEATMGFLADIGVDVRIVRLESTTLFERARAGDYMAAYYSTGGELDPISFLTARLHTRNHGAAGNSTWYANAEVDRLLDIARSTTDPQRRLELAREVEEIATEDAPWVFLNYNKAVVMHQPWVHGLQPVPTDIDFQDLSLVWLDRR